MAAHGMCVLGKEHRAMVESTCVAEGNFDSEHVWLAFDRKLHHDKL